MKKTDKICRIVALSGGKDSTAMAIRLAELHPDREYLYICTPTGDELPPMKEHWSHLEKLLNGKIIYLGDRTIYDLIDEMKMLPNWRARWCTRILKIEVAQEFYQKHTPAEIYVGLRADEMSRKGNKNALYDENIDQIFPMQEWGWDIHKVKAYLEEKNIAIPERTDCAMCFYQRIGEWWNLWKYYPDRFQKIVDLEKKIGHTLLSPGKFSNWPSPLKDLRKEFEAGRVPRGAGLQNPNKCRACNI